MNRAADQSPTANRVAELEAINASLVAQNAQLQAEAGRWMARVKLVEARAEFAASVLLGLGSPSTSLTVQSADLLWGLRRIGGAHD